MGQVEAKSIETKQFITPWKVSAKDVILTRGGPRLVDSIKPDEIFEISTNLGWIKVKRGSFQYTPMVHIEMSDGTQFDLSENSMIDEEIKVADLKIGDRISNLFNDNPFDDDNTISWFDVGMQYGARALKDDNKCYNFPHGPTSCMNFVLGWASAQNGYIMGSKFEIVCIYHLLKIAGVHDIIVEQMYNGKYKLFAYTRDFMTEKNKWCIALSKRDRFVTLIQIVTKSRACEIEFIEQQFGISCVDLGLITVYNDIVIGTRPFIREQSVMVTPPDSPCDQKSNASSDSVESTVSFGSVRRVVAV